MNDDYSISMKFIFILLLITSTYAQDGSNASNTTADGLSNSTNTTNTTTTESQLHSVTTTLGPTSSSPTTTTAPIETTTQTSTTTSFLRTTTVLIETTTMMETTTTTIPPCSEATNNTACKVCLGPLCKFVERGEQGVGWEILFVAFGLTIVGLTGLCLYYICLRPLIMGNPAQDIYWDDSEDEEEWSEAHPLNKSEIRRHSHERVRAFEIVDLNPVSDK
tara:strand:- start:53 stop:712 length:660 start_codon:yes stop_codon:yes gene_type:complete